MSIYVAQVGAHVKVGCSDDPARRVKGLLQGAVNRPLMLDHAAPRILVGTFAHAGLTDERRLHDLLSDHHCLGEWFFADEQLLEKIEAFRPMRPAGVWAQIAPLLTFARIDEPTDACHPVVVAATEQALVNFRRRAAARKAA